MNVSRLRELYSASPVARAFLDHSASRAYNQTRSKTDRVMALISAAIPDVSRGDVVAMFRELEACGCGRYVVGRHQHPSRFLWEYPMRDVGMIASGDRDPDENDEATRVASEVIETDEIEDDDDDDSRRHTFPLRADLDIDITLPLDLHKEEAVRLAFFIRSLAISG